MAEGLKVRQARGDGAAASRGRLAGGVLAVALFFLAACGGDDDGAVSRTTTTRPAPETGPNGELIVPLVEESNSGASGTATLSKKGATASVTIKLEGRGRQYRAHIHDVSCQQYRRMNDFSAQLATLTEGLSNVRGGRSKSDLIEPLSRYTRTNFSINVHKDAEPYPVVACGDLSSP
jgi:hypothetical protein